MKNFKKISAVIMALALVMCAGYFSVMSPTTAWFYQSQSVSGTNNKFVFADFDVDGDYSFERSMRFDGATAFKDPDETDFDSMVKTVSVDVKNDGGLPARIYADVTNTLDSQGLRYFYYTDDMLVDGSIKLTMEKELGGEMTDESLNRYNVGEDGNGGHYVLLNPGESKTVKIALWVEYDESGAETAFSEIGWETVDYGINIKMTATQDIDGAMVR